METGGRREAGRGRRVAFEVTVFVGCILGIAHFFPHTHIHAHTIRRDLEDHKWENLAYFRNSRLRTGLQSMVWLQRVSDLRRMFAYVRRYLRSVPHDDLRNFNALGALASEIQISLKDNRSSEGISTPFVSQR